MRMLSQSDLVVLALTSRIVPGDVPPLTARDFWPLARAVDDLQWLQGRPGSEIAEHLSIAGELADRVAKLLHRGAAIALALEQLENKGVWTATPASEAYPTRLWQRLGDAAPPYLHGVGDSDLLREPGIGVVGSRDIGAESAGVAREVARRSVVHQLSLVSGAARGVDQHAMNEAFDQGGQVVGVLADSLERTVAKPSTRQGIISGQICLVTPYSPSAPFSAGNAMGRNKVIYALSRCVVVVRSDEGNGGTWAGATEALRRGFSTIVSWTGTGSSNGNRALVEKGAKECATFDELDALLTDTPAPPSPPSVQFGDQLSMF
jgi:predicted Rossmann fold nucleotide-binding protein DprA/Smf involved in DNA uptake